MKNLTAVDYIKTSLEQDFGSMAPVTETWLEKRMEDLTESLEPITNEEQAEFQQTLELLVYPFLACYKALVDADIAEKQARNYCKKIWRKMPTTILETTLSSLV